MTEPAPVIVAVVVTFNRKALLLECLAGVFAQTQPPSRVIVIDNASTDDTEATVTASRFAREPALSYVRMSRNTGGAGGFHEGMRRALDEGAQWLWVMDDDVAPEPEALAALLRYTHLSECIHPRRVLPGGESMEWEQIFDPATTAKVPLHDASFRNGLEYCVVRVACFEGMLISAGLVRKIGLPCRDFFIGEDDTLFGFKASLHTNVLYVRTAILRKLLPLPTGMSPFKAYYAARNKLWLHRALRDLAVIDGGARVRFLMYYPFYIGRLMLLNFRPAILLATLRGVCAGLGAPKPQG